MLVKREYKLSLPRLWGLASGGTLAGLQITAAELLQIPESALFLPRMFAGKLTAPLS